MGTGKAGTGVLQFEKSYSEEKVSEWSSEDEQNKIKQRGEWGHAQHTKVKSILVKEQTVGPKACSKGQYDLVERPHGCYKSPCD